MKKLFAALALFAATLFAGTAPAAALDWENPYVAIGGGVSFVAPDYDYDRYDPVVVAEVGATVAQVPGGSVRVLGFVSSTFQDNDDQNFNRVGGAVVYDVNTGTRYTPYVGAGVQGTFVADDNDGFGPVFLAGVKTELTERLALDVRGLWTETNLERNREWCPPYYPPHVDGPQAQVLLAYKLN